MRRIIFASLLLTGSTYATQDPTGTGEPQRTGLAFNKWYIAQISKGGDPIADNRDIDKFVTADTLKKLRHALDPRYAENEYYDADFFTKSQDIGDDWADNVKIVFSEYDPVCTHIYVTFGKKQEQSVIDCMVKERGVWKVQSVARGMHLSYNTSQ